MQADVRIDFLPGLRHPRDAAVARTTNSATSRVNPLTMGNSAGDTPQRNAPAPERRENTRAALADVISFLAQFMGLQNSISAAGWGLVAGEGRLRRPGDWAREKSGPRAVSPYANLGNNLLDFTCRYLSNPVMCLLQ